MICIKQSSSTTTTFSSCRSLISSLMITLIMTTVVVHDVNAKPMQTCPEQKECIDFSFEMKSSGELYCATCQWKVCMKIKQDGNCNKKGAIGHTCYKNPNACDNDISFNNGISELVDSCNNDDINNPICILEDEGEQCQIGSSGSTLTFLLKDGKGCNADGDEITSAITMEENPNIPYDTSVTCKPTDESTTPTCTGNSNKPGKECIWTVTLPECYGTGSYELIGW